MAYAAIENDALDVPGELPLQLEVCVSVREGGLYGVRIKQSEEKEQELERAWRGIYMCAQRVLAEIERY